MPATSQHDWLISMGSSLFCVHPLGLMMSYEMQEFATAKKKLLCVPIYMNNETVHGVLPLDLSAIAWSSRWFPPHRSNRSCKPSHHVARSLDRLIGILPRLPSRIATGA